MIVMKFGGTSVEDASAMRRVMEIVKREKRRTPLVILSACSGVTNDLIRIAKTVHGGNDTEARKILDGLVARHHKIAGDLLSGQALEAVLKAIDAMFGEIANYIQGVRLLGELTPRTHDAFTSYGERLSSEIFASALNSAGVSAALVDARKVMITDDAYVNAVPQFNLIEKNAQDTIAPLIKKGAIVVSQGFIGSTANGVTTTIGRGGSDYTAAIFGAALGAEEIQIWTDVDGMMTTDPRVTPGARLIERLSFDEASELAYFGAKVLHPNTILPAVKKNIPVRILNSRKPEVVGTLIVESETASGGEIAKSIAFKKGITVINVNSSRMLMAHGFLARLFTIFAERKKSIDVVSTSEVSVSVTIDDETGLQEICEELEKIGETRVQKNKAIVCIVGGGMKHTPGIAARIFGALAKSNINVEMVSEGASEINLTMVVDGAAADNAVRVLHKEFFGN
ncbi:MAG TPA: lysine-sensitive aspartokinase 3 [Bacteroidota bacterium]|nr:lysine-sensitive aspartokinase 3 [Bacteroidota bacterium]